MPGGEPVGNEKYKTAAMFRWVDFLEYLLEDSEDDDVFDEDLYKFRAAVWRVKALCKATDALLTADQQWRGGGHGELAKWMNVYYRPAVQGLRAAFEEDYLPSNQR